jgi:Plasmid pRiA4b ORF-3-like protein
MKSMVFKFTLLSDEVDDFARVITIDSEAKFIDLNNAILESVAFDKSQMTSFFMCSDNWEKGQEITLVEMESGSEYDNLVMDKTSLDELLIDEKQKVLFVFDVFSERAFFMELSEIITGKSQDKPKCISKIGEAPAQLVGENVLDNVVSSKAVVGEDFYGDEDYELDELDEEGFGEMNFDDSSLFSEDPKF